MKISLFIVTTLACLLSVKGLSTAQIPDILIYGSDTIEIYSNPLGDTAKSCMARDTAFMRQRCASTACWREYQATYKVIGNKLYLVKMTDCCMSFTRETKVLDLSIAFKESYTDSGVFIGWFNGNLYAPVGERLYYEHMGYQSVFEREIVLLFEQGLLSKMDTVDNTKTRLAYTGNNQKMSEFVIKNVPDGTFDDLKGELKVYFDIKADDTGKVIHAELHEWYDTRYEAVLTETILKITDWDVLYRHGEKVELPYIFPVIINEERLKMYGKK